MILLQIRFYYAPQINTTLTALLRAPTVTTFGNMATACDTAKITPKAWMDLYEINLSADGELLPPATDFGIFSIRLKGSFTRLVKLNPTVWMYACSRYPDQLHSTISRVQHGCSIQCCYPSTQRGAVTRILLLERLNFRAQGPGSRVLGPPLI